MIRKILSYGFVEALSKGLNKLQILILPFLLTTEDYGKIGLLMSVELLLPFITLLGFERTVLRFHNNEQENIEGFSKTIFTSIKFTHLFVFFGIIVVYGLGYRDFFGLELFPDLLMIVVMVYFQSYNSIMLMMYRVEGNHKDYFRSKLALQLSKFVIMLLAVFLMKSYYGFLMGSLIVSYSINLIFKKRIKKEEKFNKDTFRYLFYFSWPFIFHGLAMNLLGNADKFVIKKYLSFIEVGQYTFIYSFGSMLLFAFIGISVYMEPLIYQSKTQNIRELNTQKFILIALLSGFIFFLVIEISSISIIPYLYGSKYDEVIPYISYISMAYLLYPYYLASNYRMIYDKKTKLIAVTSITSCIIALTLNIVMIPVYGIYGAVIVNFISYAFQIAFFLIISNKFKLKYELFEFLLVSFLLFCIVYFKLPTYTALIVFFIYMTFIFLIKKQYKILLSSNDI
jgi:O-antigen/teichoic acid export membrane protein